MSPNTVPPNAANGTPSKTRKDWPQRAAAALAFVALVAGLSLSAKHAPPSIVDVQRIALANGFYVTVCGEFASEGALRCRKIVISNQPMSEEDAASLCMSRPEHPSWRDRVCVIGKQIPGTTFVLPIPDDIVDNLFFFGDTEIIRAIKASLATAGRRT
jgi:hypothetical protein